MDETPSCLASKVTVLPGCESYGEVCFVLIRRTLMTKAICESNVLNHTRASSASLKGLELRLMTAQDWSLS